MVVFKFAFRSAVRREEL